MGAGLLQRGLPAQLAPQVGRTTACLHRPGGLRPLTHSHAVHVALEDIEGVPQVPFRYVEDDVSVVVGKCWRDGSQEDDLCESET